MPQPIKAGSARRSRATNKSDASSDAGAVALKKDGTPRRKPGPKPGSKRGGPKPGARRKASSKKKFLLYAVDGHELSFICESEGATGQIAVVNAVKSGSIQPETPIVPLAPRSVQRVIEIEAVEREVTYKVKSGKKRRGGRRAAQDVEPSPNGGEPAEQQPVSARPSVRRQSARRQQPVAPSLTPPAPGEKQGNPFAE